MLTLLQAKATEISVESQAGSGSTFHNGREALAILEASAWVGVDCVLMDVQMPEMDGFECTAHIRSKESATGVHLPIVAMTAHAMSGDEGRCLAAGMDAYLSKPVASNALFDVVDQQLLEKDPGP